MNKIWITFFIFQLWINSTSAQINFYAPNTIQAIKIYFPFSNWDYRLDTASAGADGYTIADSVMINGIKMDSVGIKYKGNSTNNANNKKNPFHLSLNEYKTNQDYQGFTDVKLNNGFADPSLVREFVGYAILNNYMDAPKSNFATVYVNDVWRGIYANTESINKKFIGEKYYSKNGAFFKCNPKVYSNTTYPTLVPDGIDTTTFIGTAYKNRYELKSNVGWTAFLNFQNSLATNPAAMPTQLDIDRALWMHAYNDVLVNLDSYSGAFAQNYYMYKDANGLWIPTVWDLNMCFGGFTNLGNGNNLSTAGLQQLPLLLHNSNTARPFISQLISNPTWRKMYVAHCKTIATEMLSTNQYYTIATAAQNLIKDSIAVDSLLFYNYAKFLINKDTIANGIVGIKQLMATRNNFLQVTPEFLAAEPIISNLTITPLAVAIGSTTTITATITNADSAYLGFREIASKPFTKIKMYDDGTHNDGAANDNVYGAGILVTSGKMDYYIYASNANAGKFSPVRAEHEFHSLIPNITPATFATIAINEVMPSNNTTIADANGQFDDYIELHNKTVSTITLSGMYLSDDKNNLSKWAFPINTTIPAYGYQIVWADQDAGQTGLHASFKLSSAADQIYLSYANGTIVDSVRYTLLGADQAYGRCANGVGAFTINLSPTPNTSNACYVNIDDVHATKQIIIYPNPATNTLYISANKTIQHLEIYNAIGVKIVDQLYNNLQQVSVGINSFANGIYFVKVDNEKVIKFVKE
jgi:CotH kinase protein/Lamin Tail Domain/Secretion system C-terminal sorting domain